MKYKFLNSTGVAIQNLKKIVGNDDVRFVLKGVLIDCENNRIVGTDAKILARYKIQPCDDNLNPIEEKFKKEDNKIVPIEFFDKSKYMGNLRKEQNFLYVLDKDYARVFLYGKEVFKCEYIEGRYPEYQNVFPNKEEQLELSEIAFNLNLMNKASLCVPRGTLKDFKFTFFGKTKCCVLESNSCVKDVEIIIMPIMLENGN